MRLRLSRPWWLMLALALVLASVLVFLFYKTRNREPLAYQEHLALLSQIRQLDARWELAAMKSRVGLNSSYDPLVGPLANLDALQQQLDTLSGPAQHEAPLRSAIAAFRGSLENKAALIESFKSHNAVLHNSLTFLPTAAQDIEHSSAPQHNAAQQRDRLLRVKRILLETLIFNASPAGGASREIEQELAQLSATNRTASAGPDPRTGLFMMHVQTILREHGEVNDQLSRIAAEPTAMRIDDIQRLLTLEQVRSGSQMHFYRLCLLGFSAALTALLLLAAMRLLRNHLQLNRINAQLQDANDNLEHRVQQRTAQLQHSNAQLHNEIRERKQREAQLIQSSKLASIGHLAAGVAHEINNPLGFISSNFNTLGHYLDNLFELLAAYEQAMAPGSGAAPQTAILAHLADARERVDPDYLKQDIPVLLAESAEGMERVRKIVQDLREFSRVDSGQAWQWVDLHQNIDATLNIIGREIREVAEVVREYGALPGLECQPSQLNQVILNLLKNAAHAISPARGTITIRTGSEDELLWFEISDTGCGITPEVLPHIFDPFFTTREIGKGAGLGLSLAYGIVQEHGGEIKVQTSVAGGSTFRVVLPRQRVPAA